MPEPFADAEESLNALAQSINQLALETTTPVPAENKGKSQSQPKEDNDPVPLPELAGPPTANESDFRVTYQAKFGAEILQQGKDDLMKRLETYSEHPSGGQPSHVASPSSP